MVKRIPGLVKRQLKRQSQQVQDLSSSAEKSFERNFYRRWERLKGVRRFMFAWVSLATLLIVAMVMQVGQLNSFFQRLQPVDGGIYEEGVVGLVSNVNPIYATSDTDTGLSRLLFAGLLTYDNQNKLVGNLANGYSVSADGKTYKLTLKPGLTWHDGKPLTSADVLFTFQTVQNPDARSPLQASWQGVTISAPDAQSVTFVLPAALASFPTNLTTGVLPKHLLGKTKMADLRSSDFNTAKPIGAGPFMWRGLEVAGTNPANAEEQIGLLPFEKYAGGKPKLGEFILHAYASESALEKAFANGQLTAAAGLTSPLKKPIKEQQTHSLVLTAGTYVFFKTTSGVLSDAKVRQALVAASNPAPIIASLGYTTRPVTGPLLKGQLGQDAKYDQATNDTEKAKKLFNEAGWQLDSKDNKLRKDGKQLRFGVVAVDTPEYKRVLEDLQRQWARLGVQIDVRLESATDYATTLTSHSYDATLHGISIGADPDVFAYWDSSQADVRAANRLNLSEWKNTTADGALRGGRTRLDAQLRVIKYAPLLQAWKDDAPALGLYQPRYLYLTRGTVHGLPTGMINNGADRFNDVQNWRIRTARVTQD